MVGVLPPLSNSWIVMILWLYIALNGTPNIDCYWVGAVPKIWSMQAWAFLPLFGVWGGGFWSLTGRLGKFENPK